jgi:hypothetical protein
VAVDVTAVAAAGEILLEDSSTFENYLHFKPCLWGVVYHA